VWVTVVALQILVNDYFRRQLKKMMKQCLRLNVEISWLPYSCKIKNDFLWRIRCQLRDLRFLCSSRSHKKSKLNSKCGSTLSPSGPWISAGG